MPVLSDHQLADALGLSADQFVRLPLFVREFCRELLGWEVAR
jgi:hypothetical protein